MNEALATVLASLSAAIAILVVAWFGGKLIGVLLRRLARRTPSDYDDGLVVVWTPLVGWLVAAIGFALAAAWLDFLAESGRWFFGEIAFFMINLQIIQFFLYRIKMSIHFLKTPFQILSSIFYFSGFFA